MANNSWFAFHGYNNGHAIDASQFDMTELDSIGMHGYPTQAQAQANPNSVDVFQAPAVNAAIDDYNNARDLSPTVANNPTNPASAGQAAVNTGKNAAKGVIPDIFGKLNVSNLFLRVGEVLLGLVLIAVGVAKMTDKVPVATKVAAALA